MKTEELSETLASSLLNVKNFQSTGMNELFLFYFFHMYYQIFISICSREVRMNSF